MDKLVSWEVVSSRLEIAMDKATRRESEEQKSKEEEDGQKAGREFKEMYMESDGYDSDPE